MVTGGRLFGLPPPVLAEFVPYHDNCLPETNWREDTTALPGLSTEKFQPESAVSGDAPCCLRIQAKRALYFIFFQPYNIKYF
jgi:hypothetical protein